MFREGLLIGKHRFQNRAMLEKKTLFMAHCQQVPKAHQLNIKGTITSKMNVLHYLALQLEALINLLQETHWTDAEKLVFPSYQLAGSF